MESFALISNPYFAINIGAGLSIEGRGGAVCFHCDETFGFLFCPLYYLIYDSRTLVLLFGHSMFFFKSKP